MEITATCRRLEIAGGCRALQTDQDEPFWQQAVEGGEVGHYVGGHGVICEQLRDEGGNGSRNMFLVAFGNYALYDKRRRGQP